MPKTIQKNKFQVWVGGKEETIMYSGIYKGKIMNVHSIFKVSLLASVINLTEPRVIWRDLKFEMDLSCIESYLSREIVRTSVSNVPPWGFAQVLALNFFFNFLQIWTFTQKYTPNKYFTPHDVWDMVFIRATEKKNRTQKV